MLEVSFPFAPAERWAWPGGYPIGYLVDDGEYLCAACVNDSDNPVHFGGDADGWRVEGLFVLEGSAEDYDGEVRCAHCSYPLVPGVTEYAESDGYSQGLASGSWVIDGNTSEETARALLTGLEDGDPAVYDSLPLSPLSGEWADSLTPSSLLSGYGLSEDDPAADDVCSAYEEGFSRGVEDAVCRAARAMLGIPEGHAVKVFRTLFVDVEDGDYVDADTDEDIRECEPDEYDREESKTAVDLAAEVLRDVGATEPSTMPGFHEGIWYSDPDGSYVNNYVTGERCATSAHLYGFTENEQREVWSRVTGRQS